jgi:hypothetical protein
MAQEISGQSLSNQDIFKILAQNFKIKLNAKMHDEQNIII